MNRQSGNPDEDDDLLLSFVDAAWVRKQLHDSGRSQADLARFLKLAPPIVNKIVKGKRLIKAVEADRIREFFRAARSADAITFPQQRIRNELNMRGSTIDANITPPLRSEMARDIPILGTVSTGAGALQMVPTDAVDWARRPPRLAGRTDVFGLYVEDLAMIPAFRHGSLVLVERARPPSPGDDVFIEIAPDTPSGQHLTLIRHLVALTTTTVRIKQYDPPKERDIPRKQVTRLYRVMPLADLLGV